MKKKKISEVSKLYTEQSTRKHNSNKNTTIHILRQKITYVLMLVAVDITLSFPRCSFFVDSWKVLTCHCSTVGCHSECDTSEPEQPAARTRHQSPTATHTDTEMSN